MAPVEWAIDPWGLRVPTHVAWFLVWVAVGASLLFLAVHAAYVRFLARPRHFATAPPPPGAAQVPERVPRHGVAARLFHWIMAAAMLALLLTAFLPRVGVRFPWVTYHWIAGLVLTASVVFHVVHASFWLDFRSIWPDRTDLRDATHRLRRFAGQAAPPPRRFAKYPLENKLYHAAVVVAGLAAIATGLCMLLRVRTPFLPRDPYLFGDMTWGLLYVLHGLAGVGLIALVTVHVYFGLRPEKRPITRSMVLGWMSREFYLEEHDPQRWAVGPASAPGSTKGRT
jgi:cytochrome b subunit of formate dehydrogenase